MNDESGSAGPISPAYRQKLERSLKRRWGPLRFPRRIEKTYREHHRRRWRYQTLVSLLFGLGVYVAFGLLDFWLFPDVVWNLWLIRYGIVTPLGIACLLGTWRAQRDWQVQLIYALFIVIAGASITTMMLWLPADLAHLYAPGVFLVIAFGYIVSTLRLWYATAAGLTIFALHMAADIWLLNADVNTLRSDIFFYGGINLIGFYGALVIEIQMRRDFANTALVEMDRRWLANASTELTDLSSRDHLTGVANRRTLERFLEDAWINAEQASLPISALMLDLDHFKRFNDEHGHQAGDQCLHDVATHILPLVRQPTDLVARYGGEEFVVVLPGTDHDDALDVAERIRAMVEELPIPVSGEQGTAYITTSIGAATVWPAAGGHPATLVHAADKALYLAKRDGRNRVRSTSA